MKKNVFKKAMALCLALMLCIGALAGCGGTKQLTAKEHFDLAVNTQEKEINDSVITAFGNAQDSLTSETGVTVETKVTIGDAAKQMASSLLGGISLDWLKDIGLVAGYKMNKGVTAEEMTVSLNGTKLATVDLVADVENGKMYVSLPDLLASSLSIDLKGTLEQMAGSANFSALLDVKSWMPDEATVKALLDKYTKLVLGKITNVTKEDAEVSTQGVTQKCSKLQTVLNSETLKAAADAVADEVEKDTDLSAVLEKIGKVMNFKAEDVVKEIADGFRNLDTELNAMTINVFADDKGNMAGLEITNEAGDKTLCKLMAPTQDGKNALELTVNSPDGHQMMCTGTGTLTNGKQAGSYAVSVDTYEVATIDVENLDEASAKKGLMNGSFTIKFSKGLASAIDADAEQEAAIGMLNQFSVKVDAAQTSATDSKSTVSVLDASGNTFVGVDVTTKGGADVKAEIPTEKVVDMQSEEAGSVLLSIDWNKLMENIKAAGAPEELLSSIFSLGGLG